MTHLIDVATTSMQIDQEEEVTVAVFLEMAGLDLSNSKDVTVRVNGQKVEMTDMVYPEDVVLVTRNIEGG